MTLKEHTVKSYDKDLKAIAATIDEMAELVAHSLDIVREEIENPREDLLQKITEHDYKINSLDFFN